MAPAAGPDIIDIAWDAAVAVTSAAYGVGPDEIDTPTRGRGPRPPQRIWEAKKMAVHLAVLVSGCAYTDLARRLGYHRDTVTSHCASMREAMASDADLEELSNGLERAARLRAASQRLTAREVAASDPLDKLLGALREYSDSFIRHSSDKTALHPTKVDDHGTVIKINGTVA